MHQKVQAIDWLAHMPGYESSGMSIKDYCRAHGLNFREFKNFRYRYNYKKQSGKNTPSPQTSSFKRFDVRFSELRLRVEAGGEVSLHGIEPAQLPAILEAVGALSK